MSNQVGLLLSFVFLSFFIIFSGEILAYQQTSAKTLAMTTQIALYVEKYGYSQEELDDFKYLDYLDEIKGYKGNTSDKSTKEEIDYYLNNNYPI